MLNHTIQDAWDHNRSDGLAEVNGYSVPASAFLTKKKMGIGSTELIWYRCHKTRSHSQLDCSLCNESFFCPTQWATTRLHGFHTLDKIGNYMTSWLYQNLHLYWQLLFIGKVEQPIMSFYFFRAPFGVGPLQTRAYHWIHCIHGC